MRVRTLESAMKALYLGEEPNSTRSRVFDDKVETFVRAGAMPMLLQAESGGVPYPVSSSTLSGGRDS